MLELKDFEAAYNKVQEVVLPTKLIKSDYFSDQTGNDVYLKPENMQLTGAYKIRGAYYKISTLSEEEKAKGLITASAGNHAQGVALAAARQGVKATIVALTPCLAAANATPCAWFPADAVINPFAFSSSDNVLIL